MSEEKWWKEEMDEYDDKYGTPQEEGNDLIDEFTGYERKKGSLDAIKTIIDHYKITLGIMVASTALVVLLYGHINEGDGKINDVDSPLNPPADVTPTPDLSDNSSTFVPIATVATGSLVDPLPTLPPLPPSTASPIPTNTPEPTPPATATSILNLTPIAEAPSNLATPTNEPTITAESQSIPPWGDDIFIRYPGRKEFMDDFATVEIPLERPFFQESEVGRNTFTIKIEKYPLVEQSEVPESESTNKFEIIYYDNDGNPHPVYVKQPDYDPTGPYIAYRAVHFDALGPRQMSEGMTPGGQVQGGDFTYIVPPKGDKNNVVLNSNDHHRELTDFVEINEVKYYRIMGPFNFYDFFPKRVQYLESEGRNLDVDAEVRFGDGMYYIDENGNPVEISINGIFYTPPIQWIPPIEGQ